MPTATDSAKINFPWATKTGFNYIVNFFDKYASQVFHSQFLTWKILEFSVLKKVLLQHVSQAVEAGAQILPRQWKRWWSAPMLGGNGCDGGSCSVKVLVVVMVECQRWRKANGLRQWFWLSSIVNSREKLNLINFFWTQSETEK